MLGSTGKLVSVFEASEGDDKSRARCEQDFMLEYTGSFDPHLMDENVAMD